MTEIFAKGPTPDDIADFWQDEKGRIDDEVLRLEGLMKERTPGTGFPTYLKGSAFVIPLPDNADPEFMEKVAAALVNLGWQANYQYNKEPYSSHSKYIIISSPKLEDLPHPPKQRFSDD